MRLREAGEREERLRLALAEDRLRQHFAERGAERVAVAGAAARDPHVVRFGVGVHDEVAVRAEDADPGARAPGVSSTASAA